MAVVWLATSLVVLVRIMASRAWQRHVQQQQVAIVEAILRRWLAAMGKPFPEMSPEEQLGAIDHLEHISSATPPSCFNFSWRFRSPSRPCSARRRHGSHRAPGPDLA